MTAGTFLLAGARARWRDALPSRPVVARGLAEGWHRGLHNRCELLVRRAGRLVTRVLRSTWIHVPSGARQGLAGEDRCTCPVGRYRSPGGGWSTRVRRLTLTPEALRLRATLWFGRY